MTRTAGERVPALPLRELLDGDAERGVIVFDEDFCEVYSNPTAWQQLSRADRSAQSRIRDAIREFRMRLRRGVATPPSDEFDLAADERSPIHAAISELKCERGRWFVVRLCPSSRAPEPTARRLGASLRVTSREADVALHVSKGLSNAEVASRLGVTEKTIKNAMMALFHKLGVRNRVELTLKVHGFAIGVVSHGAD